MGWILIVRGWGPSCHIHFQGEAVRGASGIGLLLGNDCPLLLRVTERTFDRFTRFQLEGRGGRVAVAAAVAVVTGDVSQVPPAGTVSCEVYIPGVRSVTSIVPPSEIVPLASPLKVKLSGASSGSVCFSTMIVPCAVAGQSRLA